MSEYQCYEFVALDRPLTSKEISKLRTLSTRAEISPTRFWNEYQWGDLKADPADLLAHYFDAFLYFANWGTRRFMLRLPATHVDMQQMQAFFPGRPARITKTPRHVIIDLLSDDDDPEDDWSETSRLGSLVPLRAQLLQGDLSAAYVAWLLAVQEGDVPETKKEPPIPPGLGEPSAPLLALADFLRIDKDLWAAATEASAASPPDTEALRQWIASLPIREKDAWLEKAVDDPALSIGTQLTATFRRQSSPRPTGQRTVRALLERAAQLREMREEAEAKRAAKAQRALERARQERLATLDQEGAKAWKRLAKLIENRRYDDAVKLTLDLRDAALLAGKGHAFEINWQSLRKQYSRRRGYLDAVRPHLGRGPD
jgi:hypothetical protein